MTRSWSRVRHWQEGGAEVEHSKALGLTAAIADGCRVFAADFGGDGVYGKATFAGEALGLGYLRKGREHQKFAGCAGFEVISARFEIRAKAPRYYRNKRQARFSHRFRDGLFSRRNASGNDNAAAFGMKDGSFDFRRDIAFAGTARDLNEHLAGRLQKKVVADRIAAFFVVEIDAVRYLEQVGVFHYLPAAFGVLEDIGGHSFELTLRKKNRIVETGKPEGRRAIEEIWLFERGVGFCASDLEASDHFAKRRGERLFYPDYAMEMFGHDRPLARLNLGEYIAEVFPRGSHFVAKRRILHFAVFYFAKYGAAMFDSERDHIDPRLAIIPARQANAGFKVAVFVAFFRHWLYYSKKSSAEAAPGETQDRHGGRAWRDIAQGLRLAEP